MSRYCVFDTETTGLPETPGYMKYYDPSRILYYNNSRLIELAYQIYTEDTNELLEQSSMIVNPNNEFRITNEEFHQISNEKAENEGKLVKDVLTEFLDRILHPDMILVGHNINFDVYICASELFRMGMDDKAKEFLKLKRYCTMEHSKNILNIQRILRNGKKITKDPSLKECYEYFMKKPIENQHRALSDVQSTSKVYKELQNY